MSIISGVSNTLLNTLFSNSNSSALSSEATSDDSSTSALIKAATSNGTAVTAATTSSVDAYLAQSQGTSLADYIDDSSGDSGLYSILTYGATGQVQTIVRQMETAEGSTTGSSTNSANSSGSTVNKVSST